MDVHTIEYKSPNGKVNKINFYIWLTKYENGSPCLIINDHDCEEMLPSSIKLTTNLTTESMNEDENIIYVEEPDDNEDKKKLNSLYSIRKYVEYMERMTYLKRVKDLEKTNCDIVKSGFKSYRAYEVNVKLLSGQIDPLQALFG